MKVMGLSRSWISFSWKWLATMKWSWIYKSWHTLMNRLLREKSLKLKPQNVVIDCLLVSPNFFLLPNTASTNLYKLTFCTLFLIHLSSHTIEVQRKCDLIFYRDIVSNFYFDKIQIGTSGYDGHFIFRSVYMYKKSVGKAF